MKVLVESSRFKAKPDEAMESEGGLQVMKKRGVRRTAFGRLNVES